MVRDIRVKEVRFSVTNSATTTGSQVSTHVVNGEVLAIDFKYGSQGATGSLSIFNATTAETYWSNILPSGAGWQTIYPQTVIKNNVGVIPGTGSITTNFIINDLVVFSYIAALSGTTAVEAVLKYR